MSEIDPTELMNAIIELATIFLVTIPSIFLSTALNGGVIFIIFTTIFDTPEIFTLVVILSLVGGVWLWLKSMGNTKSNFKIKPVKNEKFK